VFIKTEEYMMGNDILSFHCNTGVTSVRGEEGCNMTIW
jgi:hypothetical protein